MSNFLDGFVNKTVFIQGNTYGHIAHVIAVNQQQLLCDKVMLLHSVNLSEFLRVKPDLFFTDQVNDTKFSVYPAEQQVVFSLTTISNITEWNGKY